MTGGLLVAVVAGSAAAGFVSGASGFAFSMVAMSVWAWSLEPRLVAPMVVFGALVAQLLSLAYVWRGAHWRLLLPLLLGGVAGVPLGAELLAMIDARLFRIAVGSVMVAYPSLLLLVRRPRPVTRGGAAADAAIGFVGGAMGGLAGLTGPVPILWCSLRGWSRDTQRGVFQGYSTAMQALTLAVYAWRGALTPETGWIFAVMVPAIVLPAWAGVQLYRRIDEVQFRRLVLVLLVLSGMALIAGAVKGR
jgi:uncharacterized membrane protein YfcA